MPDSNAPNVIDLAKLLISSGQQIVDLAIELQRWREIGEALHLLEARYPTLSEDIQAARSELRARAATESAQAELPIEME